MKEKKFPVLPVSILGVAVIGGAIMISNKPLVGDPETIAKELERRAYEEAEEKARTNVEGDSRRSPSDLQLKKELEASMKTQKGEESMGGNSGVRKPREKIALITFGVIKPAKKAPVNEAMTATGWYREQYRGEKK